MTAVKTIGLLASALIAVGSISSDAYGEAAQDFYRNKQVRLIVGHPVGNDHDVGGRLLAQLPRQAHSGPSHRHRPEHDSGGERRRGQLRLRPGAARRHRHRHVLAQFPEPGDDGPAQHRGRSAPLPCGSAPPRFPARVCTAWTTAAVKTTADLFTSELIVGGSGAASTLSIVPTVLNHVLGTKFRIIEGYKAAQDVLLAIERGELQGVCSSYSQFRSLRPAVPRGQAAHPVPRRGGADPGPAGRADDLRPGQDRRAAPAHALRVFERRVRPALCVPARRAEGARRDHAQGDRRRGPRSRADRGGREDEARHGLSPARASGTADREPLRDVAGDGRNRQEARSESGRNCGPARERR